MKNKLIEFKNVTKTYIVGDKKFNALNNINLTINQGEFVVILGPSGAGKSTLLNLLGGLDRASKGSIIVDDKDITKLSDSDLTKYRATDVGFIFQFYNIMPTLTVGENVALVRDVTSTTKKVKEVLNSVGLERHMNKFPSELSGGEQQRVAIARSLAYNPKMIVADEPTGNLDKETEKEILDIYKKLAHDENKCIIIVTHSPNVCQMVDIVYELKKVK